MYVCSRLGKLSLHIEKVKVNAFCVISHHPSRLVGDVNDVDRHEMSQILIMLFENLGLDFTALPRSDGLREHKSKRRKDSVYRASSDIDLTSFRGCLLLFLRLRLNFPYLQK